MKIKGSTIPRIKVVRCVSDKAQDEKCVETPQK